MESFVIDKIKHISNTEVIRRLLIKYFIDKGFTNNFDRRLHPSLIQDLPYVIPVLSSKVEIVPHSENIDSTTGMATIGWNLFVLGSHRMYLGETCHSNLHNLARQIKSGFITPTRDTSSARLQTTPKKVILFITKVLSDHDEGYVSLQPSQQTPKQPGQIFAARQAMMGMPSQYYSRTGFGT